MASLVCLALLMFVSSSLARLTVTGTNQLCGSLPFTPNWTAAANSLISGLAPTTDNGNFGESTGANPNTLTIPGTHLSIVKSLNLIV